MLDEPLGALDRQLRERLMLELRSIIKKVGVTAIYVTHDQLEAFAVADFVAVMNQGKIEQIGSPEEVYRRPATPFVARFLGFLNIIMATVTGAHTVDSELGQLSLDQTLPQTGTTVTLLIRPSAAQILPQDQQATHNFLQVAITAVSFRGKYYQVWVQAGQQNLMFELPHFSAAAGEHIRLTLDPHAIGIFPS
jgi:ABC-type Fe3+/spermidine/putrescine transport system ATPase subunit